LSFEFELQCSLTCWNLRLSSWNPQEPVLVKDLAENYPDDGVCICGLQEATSRGSCWCVRCQSSAPCSFLTIIIVRRTLTRCHDG